MAKYKGRKNSQAVVTKRRPRSPRPKTFAEVVEAADQLSEDEQEELIAILRRRLIDAGRKRIIADVQQSRREFKAGLCRPVTPAELMREILE